MRQHLLKCLKEGQMTRFPGIIIPSGQIEGTPVVVDDPTYQRKFSNRQIAFKLGCPSRGRKRKSKQLQFKSFNRKG